MDDKTVINMVLDGDRDAFAILLDRYGHHVAKIVAAHVPGADVPEVSHEAFVRAFKSLSGYRPVKPFCNWLTTIALRTCHDFWREHYRRKEAPVCDMSADGQAWLEAALSVKSTEEFDSLIRQREAKETLCMILNCLSPKDRLVLTLCYLEERTLGETADMLGMSVANVKIRAFRARRKLREVLQRSSIHGGEHEA